MKKFKKILSAVTIAVAALGLAACSASSSSSNSSNYKSELLTKNTLTIGLEGTYSPYSYRKNGKLTGFEVDLGKAVAKEMGLKAKFVPTKWDSLIAGLGSEKFDVVLNNITQTPERKKSYNFSTPYIYSRYILVTKKGSNLKTLKALKGKKMAEGTGTNNAVLVKKYGATVVPSGEFATSVSLVRQGRVAGTVNAAEAWYAYAKENNTKGLQVTELSSQVKPVKVSGLFNKKDKKLLARFNKALKKVRKDGTLKKLSVKYFGGDITEDAN